MIDTLRFKIYLDSQLRETITRQSIERKEVKPKLYDDLDLDEIEDEET